MLLGLGHDPFVGGDDQQRDINPADAGEHVLDEALVSRHVHDAGGASAGQRQPGEAEVNSHAARLLLGEAVGVHAGERGDERGLAVVHVAGGTDATHRILM